MATASSKLWDVIGLGCTAVDELLYVDEFPAADTKTRVLRRERQFGGLTGTALVAAARLGARCAFAGILGTDEFSRAVKENFLREGVDVSAAPVQADGQVVRSVIVVNQRTGTRNVFFQPDGAMGAHDTLPPGPMLQATRVLFIDQYRMQGNLRAVKIARAAGADVVADLEDDSDPLFPELFSAINHVVLSEEFARRLTGAASAQAATAALWHADRAAVVVTCGAEGAWFLSGNMQEPKHQPAFPVKVEDTTGCGDVFHGAYAAALAAGSALPDRVRFAAAAAALKARQTGGQRGIPNRANVEEFLQPTSPPTLHL